MRQVPRYLIIGNGRVARHFRHYLSLRGFPVAQWDRGQTPDLLQTLAAQSSHILLLVSDSAIEDLFNTHLANAEATCVHFSGALTVKDVFGAHPLMTFGPDLYPPEKYKRIPFVVEEGAPDFHDLLPGLDNPHVRIRKEDKLRYHALCAMGGNFTCLLWQKVMDSFARDFGFAPAILHPYMEQQIENLKTDYRTALTGPLTRDDAATVGRHLKALEGDAFEGVYRAFVAAYEQQKEQGK